VTSLILRDARLLGTDAVTDILVADGRIRSIGVGPPARDGVVELALEGRWVIPGLWDHHVHFTQWARFRSRLDVNGAQSAREVVEQLALHIAAGAPAGELVVARGFQDALWPDEPTAHMLDAESEGSAVAVISHDLHSVWLNTHAAALLGAEPGLVREEQAFAAQVAIDRLAPATDDAVSAAIRAAHGRGVVGIRDLEMADNPVVWAQRRSRGLPRMRVDACVYPEHLDAVRVRGLTTGQTVPGTDGLVTMGSLKVFADGSLNTRTALTHDPYPGTADHGHAAHTEAGLRHLLNEATQAGLHVALHAIGDLAVTRALDAFEATGAAGSIEHAQLVAAADLARFAKLGIEASVQPEHALDDRDVTDALWTGWQSRAFAYRALVDAGAQLRLGSDAPVAPLDPWVAIAAACTRTRDLREPWQADQALSREAALAASVRSRIAVGEPADLVALDADPLTCDDHTLRAMPVAQTFVAGSALV
jgi:predicted amidohydrolase YtcJ